MHKDPSNSKFGDLLDLEAIRIVLSTICALNMTLAGIHVLEIS